MMSLLFYLFFLTPLLFMFNCFYINQFFYLFITFMFSFKLFLGFFSSISYFFGVDIYSFGLIFLSLIISSLMIMSESFIFNTNNNFVLYLLINLIILIFLLVVFSSLIIIYMYMFFEFILIPLLVLILGWGYQPERLVAGVYLFFYTVFSSVPMLLSLLYLYIIFGCLFFDYIYIFSFNFYLHYSLIFAFLISLPMFMVHFWLPSAHVQAPVSGSMILAGLMLKLGGYGIIRFFPLMDLSNSFFSYIWFSVCIYGSLLVGFICLVQGDMSSLIAYSSISHMGLCLMGMLGFSYWGTLGSFYLMIGHGLCSSGLFYLVNIFYTRTGSRSFFINKGLILYMPSCSMFMFIFCLFNMSCPPSLNFLGEIFILVSILFYWFYSFMYFIFISFLSACFSYYLYSFSQQGSSMFMYSFCFVTVDEYLCLFYHIYFILSSCFLLNLY